MPPRVPPGRLHRQGRRKQIEEWLRRRGTGPDSSGSAHFGKRLPRDRHEGLSRTLGVHRDYVHSKILADNNVRPESVERRLALDAAWEELREELRRAYADGGRNASSDASMDEFVSSRETRKRFGDEMKRLDGMAKGVNDSIISDTFRFNGRCPVRHARRFNFEDRVREAIVEMGGSGARGSTPK